ncbi:16301_t:CDS:2 [Cetraspora pellucida]|uniref:16301_t:CDS:1 n=1 Tax=Cetraspora pellucida TaxID=1433469 RepID=A0A9N9CP95_9GLOM|nr:16301_t:CDS:2 [Cetraspora pellucida]
MENKDNFELTEKHFSNIELHNEDLAIVIDEQTVGSWDELNFVKLYFNHILIKSNNNNEDSAIIVGKLGVEQTASNWNELDCNELYNEDSAIIVGELDCNELYNEDLANIMNEPAAGQIFGSWNELDHFISFYAKSQNFVNVIYGSEYRSELQFDLNKQSNLIKQTDQFNSHEDFNTFVEDCIDISAIFVKELIPSTKQHPFIIGLGNSKTSISVEQTFPDLSFRQQEYDDETTSSSSSDKENFIIVENLIVYPKKGAPRKKWFKASNELEKKYVSDTKQHLEIQKTRKQTQCQQCQNTGHNRASCEAWHKQQSIPYSY